MMKMHALSSLCESSKAALVINICALLMQIVFIFTMVQFIRQQSILEHKASSKNPLGFLPPSLLWGTCVTSVVFAIVVVIQAKSLLQS